MLALRRHSCVLLFVAASANAQVLLQEQPLPGSGLPINGFPPAVIAADLDDDGDDDLVVGEATGPVILRQQGGVLVRETFASGLATGNVIMDAGDFDHDGHTDLLLGIFPSAPPSIRIWWGDGTGQFPTATQTIINLPLIPPLFSIAHADLDGDGDIDFVLSSPPGSSTPATFVWRNQGNRTFLHETLTQLAPGATSTCQPFCVDVDGDGAPEIVFVSRDGRTRLYWNNAGSFVEATAAEFPLLQTSLRGLAVGDFDGDGDRDMVFGGDNGPGVMLRTVSFRHLVQDPVAPVGVHTLAVIARDTDGDGDLDLLVFTRDQVLRCTNNGAGSFATAAAYGTCDDTRYVVPVDIDGDGDVDFVRFGLTSGTPPTATTSVLYTVAPDKYTCVGANRLPVSTSVVGTASGDINGDGWVDFLLQNGEPTGATLQCATGDGAGAFAFRWANRVGGVSGGFFVDVNGDGRDEYVFTGTGAANSYLPNIGGQLASTSVLLPFAPTTQTSSGAGIDIDGDGDNDLVYAVALGNNYALRVLVNHGGGSFVDETATRVVGPLGSGMYPKVFVADLDGDGDPDVWVHSWGDDSIYRLQNGVLSFVPGAVPVNGMGGDDGALGDFDGDGRPDLKSGIYVLRNLGGTFAVIPNALPNVSGASGLFAAADIDDDGDLDLIGSGFVAWNNGNGTFVTAPSVLPFAWGTGNGVTQVLDIDRDGDPDVIASINGHPVLLVNQLRQMRLVGQVHPGGVLDMHHVARPGQVAQPTLTVFACSFAEIAPTLAPGLGWLRIDPAQAILLGPFALPAAGGEIVQQESVPASPSLIGAFFCAQPLELRGSRLRLGNFVSTWIY